MDKNAIKKYAVWARRELISRVSQKAQQFGITEKNIVDANVDSINGHILSVDEKKQRQALITEIKQKDYEHVMEEVAYTWFNRFSALRFMEVNGYLPTHIRVFTDENGAFKPQILAEAIHLELGGLDMKKVFAYKEASNNDELYKYLLITQCNALSAIMPGMFQRIADYTELLFPDNLLRDGSVLEQMITLIPEADWKDQVQIIGWLYQYYNTEPKDKVFADLKKNIKITKENIPSATQLFTPDWIVRYMVENSLGRLWIEGHSESKSQLLPSKDEQNAFIAGQRDVNDVKWHYYLEEAKQSSEVQAQLDKIREEYKKLKPEDIRCIDPCMGSGHILVYMFDVLMSIYEAYGYRSRDAVASIVRNNLYGLDIDDRAAQLAYFSVMMKARQYDSRFFTRGIAPNIYAIRESNGIDSNVVDYFVNRDAKLKAAIDSILTEMRDAKEYGSILNITPVDFDALSARFVALADEISIYDQPIFNDLLPLVRVAQMLAQKYDTVCTNPPYMGSSGMSAKLNDYTKLFYPDTKSDLSTVFMEKTIRMCNARGFMAMINIPVWMFLGSYEKLRASIISSNTIINMLHFGRGVFGSDFGTTSFVICKNRLSNFTAQYRKLFKKQGAVDSLEIKEKWFHDGVGKYYECQESYKDVPGNLIAYSLGKRLLEAFYAKRLVSSVADVKQGMATGDNNTFLRLWFEVSYSNISFHEPNGDSASKCSARWFPYNKGGAYRKWFGNLEYVVDWSNDGFGIKNTRDEKGKLRSRPQNLQYFFRESLTWSKVTIGGFSLRYIPQGTLFDVAGCSLFPQEKYQILLANLNSCVQKHILSIFSQSVNYEVGQIAALPVLDNHSADEQIVCLTDTNINLSKKDWDSFETSWDFKRHPLIDSLRIGYAIKGEPRTNLEDAFGQWEFICEHRFNQLKANEEELNRIFIDIYGLQDELTPEVEDKDVTVRLADKKRDIRSLISYAVGCMFGRYSLDVEGLAYADGEWDASKYFTFPADRDNIIPICDDEYFDDDIAGRFVKFIETVYGKETLDENLRFIADALGGDGQPKEVIRSYFLNGFYADHLKIYQKRPIYWLFDSGKKNGFKALIYMHRYAPDTIARMRTDYVHEQQARYRNAIADLEHRIEDASTAERVKLNKQRIKLQGQSDEIREYEEKIHHLADQMIRIDLDDGVKHNYEIFGDVLAKIK